MRPFSVFRDFFRHGDDRDRMADGVNPNAVDQTMGLMQSAQGSTIPKNARQQPAERSFEDRVTGPIICCYVSYFLPTRIITTRMLRPIQVGRAISEFKLDMPGDDTGPNISRKNSFYCELTAHYWVWKNDRTTDYIGLFHYRRFFDLTHGARSLNIAGVIVEPDFSIEKLLHYGLYYKNVSDKMTGYDGIIPAAFDVRRLGLSSLREQYSLTPDHDADDLQIVRDVIKDRDPSFLRFYDQALDETDLFANNMFIFRRPLFESYSAWLFPILLDVERRLNLTGSSERKRVIGYLAERLFTAYVLKLRAEQIYRLRYADRVLFTNVGLSHGPTRSGQVDRFIKRIWSFLPLVVRPALFRWLKR